MTTRWITSIGLDIGTSTTKLIVSELLVNQVNGAFSLPSCDIVDRKVTYQSEIYTTPLKTETEIDVEALSELLQVEYQKANVALQDVESGAVIITGETARKENAEKILHYLANRAGDFVVATAGADLEGMLAAKGSGAVALSKETEGVIANVDVGGGTANVALCEGGKVIGTFTFHIGGRLVRIQESGRLDYISPFLNPFLQEHQSTMQVGKMIDFRQAAMLSDSLADELLSFLRGCDRTSSVLLLEPLKQPLPAVEKVLVSGGVGKMMNEHSPTTLKETATFGDIGPLLAASLRKRGGEAAPETARATVIGAGMQNTEVSGATVYIAEDCLPLKNIPIVKVDVEKNGVWNEPSFVKRLQSTLSHANTIFDCEGQVAAIALQAFTTCTYTMLQELAEALYKSYTYFFSQAPCLIVLCEQDLAKALGQAIQKRNKALKVIVLDGIDFTYGDYIDIGMKTVGEAVTVSVKTLAF
ncbi:ethanolamine ammonia-lyase reactivating factor EutA [Priestia flexa]|uniref:ethanolamine ammonia-lyase reactivating factor EutA n=1 Tax=Priestia flexa TaxID=86664 RepID=UPI0032ED8923